MATINGTENDDYLEGFSVADTIRGYGGHDIIVALAGDDTLEGGDGDDWLFGGDDHDRLNGGSGLNYLDGGDGFDLAVYSDNGQGVLASILGAGSNGQGKDDYVSIEGIVGTSFSDILEGDANNNYLDGHGGGDFIYAGAGDDYVAVREGNHEVDGGAGRDALSFQLYGDGSQGIVFDLSEALAAPGEVSYGDWYILVNGIEDVNGSYGDDTITAADSGSYLFGDRGDDTLHGKAGNDVLVGDGRILFDYDAGEADFFADETINDGNDILDGAAGNDILYGLGGDDTLDGGTGGDWMFGGTGNDLLLAGDGEADYVDGGEGVDTVSYATATEGAWVDMEGGSHAGAAEGDILVSIENVIGTDYADLIAGDAANNEISGGAGDDYMIGGDGNDTLDGGSGDDHLYADAGDDHFVGGTGFDIVYYDTSASLGVDIDLRVTTADNLATGGMGTDTFEGIEGVVGTQYDDTIEGTFVANYLSGGAERGSGLNADVINGYGGDDTIVLGEGTHIANGGTGIDTLEFVNSGSDTNAGVGFTFSLLQQGGAQDTGRGMMTAHNFENLSGASTSDHLIGDGGANSLWGNSGNDVLEGNAGNDMLDGGSGNDYLKTGKGDDVAHGGTGDDILRGQKGFDVLNGDDGNDILRGNNDGDTLNGGAGNDTLRGNAGKDNMDGGADTDYLYGGGNRDVMKGGLGDDFLDGGTGDDFLMGGLGNDWLNGGSGADEFYFHFLSGDDLILDFADEDTISFASSMGLTFEDLVIEENGDHSVITWGTGDSITVLGSDSQTLDASDFDFGGQLPQAAAKEPLSALSDVAPLSEAPVDVFAMGGEQALDMMMIDAAMVA